MKKVLGAMLSLMMISSASHAASYIHQVEALVNIDQRSFDLDNGGERDFDVFRLFVNYKNQYKSRVFLIGGVDLNNGALDHIIFSVGGEYNAMANARDNIEAGGGVLLNLYTGDLSGFGFRPYGFARVFIKSQLFISTQLSYDLAFVDMNGADGDLTGIMINAGFGYAF